MPQSRPVGERTGVSRLVSRGARWMLALLLGGMVIAIAPASHLAAAGPSLCPAPTVTGVAEAGSNHHYGVPGHTVVTVSGSGFANPSCSASVTIGPGAKAATVDSTQVNVDPSGSSLTFRLPGGPGGAVTVVLTDGLGNSAASNSNFHFYSLPSAQLTTPAPPENSTVGISGANFTFGGTVKGAPSLVLCDGSSPSLRPAVVLASDTSLSFRAPSVYCRGPASLTFAAPYDSNGGAPVSMPLSAGGIDVAATVNGFSTAGPVAPGATVTVTGNGFGPAGSASFAGAPAPVRWSDSSVTLTVPGAANTGQVTLTRAGDSVVVATGQVSVAAAIRAVTPSQASTGDQVTIDGGGFGTAAGQVQIGSTPAPLVSWGPTRIVVTVPDGAHTGQLLIAPAVNAAPDPVSFVVLPHVIELSPTSGGPGTLVAIRGTGFGDTPGKITLAGRLATVTIWSDHLVVFELSKDLAAGPVTISISTAGASPQTLDADGFTVLSAAAAGPSADNLPGIIKPNPNGTPVISTKPFVFTPPVQKGPVFVTVDVSPTAPSGSDVPYTISVQAFGAPVPQLKVSVVIALEPGADGSINVGTATTDAAGRVHGFVHLSSVQGATLLLATAGQYQNEVEISTRNVSASVASAGPFLINSFSNGEAALVLIALLLLTAVALSMSRGRVAAVAGFSPAASAAAAPPSIAILLRQLALDRPLAAWRDHDHAWLRILRDSWKQNRDIFWRVSGVTAGVLLILVYLVASISTLTAIPLAIGFGSSVVLPEGTVYGLSAILVSLALTAIALRYIYYYRCWVVSRHFFGHPTVPDPAVLALRDVPYMKVQVTTKGGALPVVERSLMELERILDRHPWLQPKLTAEVITEIADEAAHLEKRFATSSLRVSAVTLPADYATPNGTRLKARALHYLVERRRVGWNSREGRTFIVHFDEETLVTEGHLLVLVDYLTGKPRLVSQGPIVYPLEWKNTPWICRALESTRPFGCSECARVMDNPPPPHLHGSNLVIDERAENAVGWDFGTLDGQPFVAEDLLFGLRAFSILGREAFGWHGATMMEQPPLSLHWAVQQRLRWVTGALQGLRAMRNSSDYDGIAARDQRRLSTSIRYRIATYALGFPVGFAGLYFLIHPAAAETQWGSLIGLWRGLILLSALGWVVSYQIGIARNLRYQVLTRGDRWKHAGVMLLLTPIAGLCETVGPFVALLRWLFGARRASWTPTPKLSDRRIRPVGQTVLATQAEGPAEVIEAPALGVDGAL